MAQIEGGLKRSSFLRQSKNIQSFTNRIIMDCDFWNLTILAGSPRPRTISPLTCTMRWRSLMTFHFQEWSQGRQAKRLIISDNENNEVGVCICFFFAFWIFGIFLTSSELCQNQRNKSTAAALRTDMSWTQVETLHSSQEVGGVGASIELRKDFAHTSARHRVLLFYTLHCFCAFGSALLCTLHVLCQGEKDGLCFGLPPTTEGAANGKLQASRMQNYFQTLSISEHQNFKPSWSLGSCRHWLYWHACVFLLSLIDPTTRRGFRTLRNILWKTFSWSLSRREPWAYLRFGIRGRVLMFSVSHRVLTSCNFTSHFSGLWREDCMVAWPQSFWTLCHCKDLGNGCDCFRICEVVPGAVISAGASKQLPSTILSMSTLDKLTVTVVRWRDFLKNSVFPAGLAQKMPEFLPAKVHYGRCV